MATEKQWQATVTQLAQTLGWMVYHTHDSRRSEPGFPDLVLARDRIVAAYAELKTDKPSSVLSDSQVRWLDYARDLRRRGLRMEARLSVTAS